VPVEVDYGSEFRYRDPIINGNTAVLAITQSGETVDTLAAMEEARKKGARLWTIVNVIGSQAMRLSDGYILMHAGPEIGVASTKAFTTSLVDLYLLGCYLGELRGTLTGERLRATVDDLARLPDLMGHVLEPNEVYNTLAWRFYDREHFLYLGRGINYPIALEGIVIALATEGDSDIAAKADYVLYAPATPALLSPVINVVPLQLLAYHLAVRRGCDVDQPRNLAKSVTVE
jgi:glucosamine--fructose-6-phosphate aminotransferase (isomerizing)